MTNEEKIRIAEESIYAYFCLDDPEHKAAILAANAGVSDEARRIHRESIVIDALAFYVETYNWYLQESGVTAMNLTVPHIYGGMGQAVWRIIDHFGVIKRDPEHFMLIETGDDIRKAKKENKIGLIIGSQTARFIEHGELESSVEIFSKMGLRIMQLGYNGQGFACDGCLCEANSGLTAAGRRLVKAMEEYGITIDLSHISEKAVFDTMELCTKPPIFSHANPRELFDHPRNITAEEAKKVAEMGGVICPTQYMPMIWNRKNLPTIEDYMNAIDYFVDLIGIDHVGLGVDSNAEPAGYDRMDCRRLMDMPHPNRDVYLACAEAGLGKASSYPAGIFGIANHVNIVDHLIKRGYCEADIKKIIGLNLLRVFDQTWPAK